MPWTTYRSTKFRDALQAARLAGGSAEAAALIGPNGHINAFTAIGQGADKIAAFLAN